MLIDAHFPKLDAKRQAIADAYRMDESALVEQLIKQAALTASQEQNVAQRARDLVVQVRELRLGGSGLDSFLYQYDLSSDEGIALMCLAEALLRVPDKKTIDSLIRDKLSKGNWKAHRGQSDSMFVNAATWALMLTGNVLNQPSKASVFSKSLKKLVSRTSEPVVRKAVEQAMRIMSKQFVMGRSIDEALKRAKAHERLGYRYSYDMLGEAARTQQDAERYFDEYQKAIIAIGKASKGKDTIDGPGISVKLSALHPRYEYGQYQRVMRELPPKLLALAQLAMEYDIALTVDAEEADRLDLSLDIIEKVFCHTSLKDYHGFGMAVQSYQKRASFVLDWIASVARGQNKRMMVRLIKGAYWDSEIKFTQMMGFASYPVFTRKASTDVSFQACAKKILSMTDAIYPQFATHNAYSVAMILELAGEYRDFEFQCLHGMGQDLYQQIVPKDKYNIPARIYAPVGSHEDLLPYLVRRLLENGANSSFVNRIVDAKAPISELIESPIEKLSQAMQYPHEKIPLPQALFTPRKNSQGIDLSCPLSLQALSQALAQYAHFQWQSGPIINGQLKTQQSTPLFSPINKQAIGMLSPTAPQDIQQALLHASQAFGAWDKTDVKQRASVLHKAADLLQDNQVELIALAMVEAGKTVTDAISEIREAIDFCRYYAEQGIALMEQPQVFQGYTGETNKLSLHGKGVMLCISPWNFPLAIFIGQIAACLVTGNTVLAKPAEQTSLMATRAVQLLHEAGVPAAVLQLLPGDGETVGATLVNDERIRGVLFTGSTQTARQIGLSLASKSGPITPLVAETGGQNAMIIDSSALLEQAVMDVIQSAFGSAGQRCSALRVLYVQQEIIDKFCQMLNGAMQELQVGDPRWLKTDIGPVIDEKAKQVLQNHISYLDEIGTLMGSSPASEDLEHGHFVLPCAYRIDSVEQLEKEVFGPILHVISYNSRDLNRVLDEINATGYGLTLGVQSRIDENIEAIVARAKVGNCYVNRNMIGAVVGLQPFGGEGLSGTGPKAGGPHYLLRLCNERTLTVNTTAAGGNASLMSIEP